METMVAGAAVPDIIIEQYAGGLSGARHGTFVGTST
jgi:hypothetical protein